MNTTNTIDDLVTKALDLACTAHKGQCRKGTGAPYIIHPLEVVKRLGSWGITKYDHPEVWAAALLHDTLEDTNLTIFDIIVACDSYSQVHLLVEELTFRSKEEGETAIHYSEAKVAYLASFVTKSVDALVIKLSDRFCNILDFLTEDRYYAVKYWDKADALFRAMIKRDQEIVEMFGKKVLENMMFDYREISLKINRTLVYDPD